MVEDMSKAWKTMYMCHCGHGGVTLSVWDGEESREIFMSTYIRGFRPPHPWSERLRHIWHIIQDGHPHLDEFVFTRETAREFANALLKIADEKSST